MPTPKNSMSGLISPTTESEFRASAALFAGILEISVDAVISMDEEHRIVLFNQGAESIFGYSTEEIIGEPLEVLLPERFRERHVRHVSDFSGGTVSSRRMDERREVFGRRKDGTEFPAEASISKLEVGGRRIFSVVLRDITGRKEHEAALAMHARELARSNRELAAFAAIASHDLQEPLRKIRTFGDRLRSEAAEDLSGRSKEYLLRMQSAATRMSDLIADLLAYARVTSRSDPFARIDLTQIAREEAEGLDVRLQETGGSIRVEALPMIDADRAQMRQLFHNLLGNALKFHREGVPPEVVITGSLSEEDGGVAEIQVQDNGIGFEEKHRDRIFELFGRLHGRDDYEGTGMGLAICKKIVERHGGTISPRSIPGVGTTMIVRIPLRQCLSPLT